MTYLIEVYKELGEVLYIRYSNAYIDMDSVITVDKFKYKVKSDSNVELSLIDRRIIERTGKVINITVENGKICDISFFDEYDIKNLKKEISWHNHSDLNLRYCILYDDHPKMDLLKKEIDQKVKDLESFFEKCKAVLLREFGNKIEFDNSGMRKTVLLWEGESREKINFIIEQIKQEYKIDCDYDFFLELPRELNCLKSFFDEEMFKYNSEPIDPIEEGLVKYINQETETWNSERCWLIDFKFCRNHLIEIIKNNFKNKDFDEIKSFTEKYKNFVSDLSDAIGGETSQNDKYRYPARVEESELSSLVSVYLSNSLLNCDYFDWVMISSIVGNYASGMAFHFLQIDSITRIINRSGTQKVKQAVIKVGSFHETVKSKVWSLNSAREIYKDLYSDGCALPAFICSILDKRISEGKVNVILPENAKTPKQIEEIFLTSIKKRAA